MACFIVIKLRSSNNITNTLIFSQACIDLITSCVLITVTATQIAGLETPQASGAKGELYCRLWDSWVILFAMSTFNLAAISIERFVAVNFPLWYSVHFSQSRAITMAITAWIMAPIMQIMLAIFQFDNEGGQCTIQEGSLTRKFQATMGVFTFLWEYFIPVALMTFAFVKITLKLRQQGRKLMAAETTSTGMAAEPSTLEDQQAGNQQTSDTQANSAKRLQRVNVTKTLFMVYIIYVICWSPNQIGFLQFNLGGPYDFQGAYHSFSVILAMCNTSVNPFIYALQYKQYRSALKALLRCQWPV